MSALTNPMPRVRVTEEVIHNLSHTLSSYDLPYTPKVGSSVFQMGEEIYFKSINELSGSSIGGLSGWSPVMVKMHHHSLFFRSFIITVCNQMYCNNAPPLLSLFLLANASTPILKPNGKLRHVGITEVFYRIACIGAVRFARIDHDLLPTQFGVGTTGGTEPLIHFTSQWEKDDPDNIVIEEDIKNAFGSIPRKLIHQGLVKIKSSLLQFFNWSHGPITNYYILTDSGNVHTFHASQGVVQGSPIAPYFFSIGFKDILTRLHTSLKVVDPKVIPLSYLDDLRICTKSYLHNKIKEIIHSLFCEPFTCPITHHNHAHTYLILNRDKERTISSTIFSGRKGAEVFGSAIGSPSFRNKFLNDFLISYSSNLDALNTLPNIQDRQLLFRYCVQPKTSYLTRTIDPTGSTSDPNMILDTYRKFQQLHVDFFGPFIASPNHSFADFNTILSLPLKKGGFGVPNVQTIAPIAYATSLDESNYFLSRLNCRLTLSSMIVPEKHPLPQKARLKPIYEDLFQQIKNSLPLRYHSTLDDHCNPSSYAFLTTPPSVENPNFTLKNSVMAFATMDRSFISPYHGFCKCGATADPCHDLNCKFSVSHRTACHESLKNVFEHAYHRTGSFVQREPRITYINPEQSDSEDEADTPSVTHRRADLLVEGGASPAYPSASLDFSVVSPYKTIPSSLREALHKRYTQKIKKYERFFDNLYPIIVSSYGTFHPTSEGIFQDLKLQNINVASLKREISFRFLNIRVLALARMYQVRRKLFHRNAYSNSDPTTIRPDDAERTVTYTNPYFGSECMTWNRRSSMRDCIPSVT
jgi:hypothetical protein